MTDDTYFPLPSMCACVGVCFVGGGGGWGECVHSNHSQKTHTKTHKHANMPMHIIAHHNPTHMHALKHTQHTRTQMHMHPYSRGHSQARTHIRACSHTFTPPSSGGNNMAGHFPAVIASKCEHGVFSFPHEIHARSTHTCTRDEGGCASGQRVWEHALGLC